MQYVGCYFSRWLREVLRRVPFPANTEDYLYPKGRSTATILWSHAQVPVFIPYSAQELERLPLYPNEVVPLFLYLGDHRHAYNAAMNYDLRVHAHLNMAAELGPAYPGKIVEMRTEVKDETGTDLLARFQEIFDFLGLFGQEPTSSKPRTQAFLVS